jgi:S-DNA-T family DNA segregation ATPase FtsK/SpoIIIE
MAAARKPAPRRPPAKSKPRARARRSSLGALGLPALEQRHLDLIGLGLVAIGVFLAFPLYLGWDGGAAGHAAKDGLAYLVGKVSYGVPVAIAAAGAILVLRPVLPAVRPFRSGALCLFAALTLMLAAGTFGIGPEGVRHGYWNAPFFEQRGGIAGDALLYCVASAVSTIGAHILAVFLLLAGVLLLTGASVAGILRATGSGLADTTRAIGRTVPARPPKTTSRSSRRSPHPRRTTRRSRPTARSWCARRTSRRRRRGSSTQAATASGRAPRAFPTSTASLCPRAVPSRPTMRSSPTIHTSPSSSPSTARPTTKPMRSTMRPPCCRPHASLRRRRT